jgi:hypothetical protein
VLRQELQLPRAFVHALLQVGLVALHQVFGGFQLHRHFVEGGGEDVEFVNAALLHAPAALAVGDGADGHDELANRDDDAVSGCHGDGQ